MSYLELTDDSLMPWGKYQGYKMIDIPAPYFLWVKDNVKRGISNRNVFDYIEDNLQVLKKEEENFLHNKTI